MELPEPAKNALDEALARQGLRSTRQRELIFAVLLTYRDHPSADEVYNRAREEMDSISLATVYNCLDTLVRSGLVRAVNYERASTRYCPNLMEHAHFQDRVSGKVYDVDLPTELMDQLKQYLPEDFVAESMELTFLGKLRQQPRSISELTTK